MNSSEFYSLLKLHFPFTPTLKQDVVLQQLSEFIIKTSKSDIYLLKGFLLANSTPFVNKIRLTVVRQICSTQDSTYKFGQTHQKFSLRRKSKGPLSDPPWFCVGSQNFSLRQKVRAPCCSRRLLRRTNIKQTLNDRTNAKYNRIAN